MKRIHIFGGLLCLVAGACSTSQGPIVLGPPPGPALAKRVVLVSVDGLRPDAIEKAGATNLKKLIERGAYCPTAETIRPSITLPSHTSMVTGLDFSRHGVVWNNYRPGHIDHPTVFSVVTKSGGQTAILFSKDKFHYLADPDDVHWVYGPPAPYKTPPEEDITDSGTIERMRKRELAEARSTPPATPPATPAATSRPKAGDLMSTADLLARAFREAWPGHGFRFTFVHFRECDEAGHRYGWMGPQYVAAVQTVDAAIGQLVEAIEAKDGFRETALLVSADHGGSDRGHYRVLDPERVENVTIPWIAAGPGIPRGLRIGRVVRTFDTAPTVLALLGLGAPMGIDGQPVREVLK